MPLVQHVSMPANPVGPTSQTGNNLKIRLPNPVGAGNCLILGLTWASSVAVPTIADDVNGAWGSPVVSLTTGTNHDSAIWVFPNAAAGQTVITVTWTTAIQPFQFEVSEFSGIATSSPGAGSVATANDAGPALACGSFTPTNNDGTGGNLIWAYFAVSATATDNPTSIVPDSGFTLLSADISGVSNDMFPHACQYEVQAAAASINPGLTATADTGNTYNCLAVALKVASGSGTPPGAGVRIVRLCNQTVKNHPTGGGTHTLQFPTTGNLIALMINESDVITISGVTDSQGNTYTKRQVNASQPQCWHTANSTPDPNLVITITIANGSSGQRYTAMCYDIAGAYASPYDSHAGFGPTSVNGQTSVSNAPTLVPNRSGLTLAFLSLGLGPATGLFTGFPIGAIFHAPTYDGETDADYLTNAAGQAHLYHSDSITENWNWSITSHASNSAMALAVSFAAGPFPDGVQIGTGTPYTEQGFAGAANGTLAAPTITGDNTCLVLQVTRNSSSLSAYTTQTYNGAPIAAYQVADAFANFIQHTVWVIPNPVSGANFFIAWAAGASDFSMQACYYTGVDPAAPYRTIATAFDADPGASPATVNVTNSLPGDKIVGCFAINDTTQANGFTSARCGSGQVFRGQVTGNAVAQGAICDEAGAAGSVTIDWASASVGGWRVVAFPLASTIPPYRPGERCAATQRMC
jgi:hypothetical protein